MPAVSEFVPYKGAADSSYLKREMAVIKKLLSELGNPNPDKVRITKEPGFPPHGNTITLSYPADPPLGGGE
jgi:hypothetical protein